MDYNFFQDRQSPKNNIDAYRIDNNSQMNYPSSNRNNQSIGYKYDQTAFNNPNNIYKRQSITNNRIGNISNLDEEEYIKKNVKSFNNKTQQKQHQNYENPEDFQNMNYSNISNRDYPNANYSGDEMGNYEVLEHQHENQYNRSPDSLLRYNNSDSQSPEERDISSQKNNLYNRNNNILKENERSPPENINNSYFKKYTFINKMFFYFVL